MDTNNKQQNPIFPEVPPLPNQPGMDMNTPIDFSNFPGMPAGDSGTEDFSLPGFGMPDNKSTSERKIMEMESAKTRMEDALQNLEQKIIDERRLWEEKTKSKDQENWLAKEEIRRLNEREKSLRTEKERELHSTREQLEQEIKDIEKKLNETREKTWLHAIRAKEGEMSATRVEMAIKESQIRMVREQKDKEVQDTKEKLEKKFNEQIEKTRDNYQKKIEQLQDLQLQLKDEIKEKERLLNEERTLYQERVKSKENEIFAFRNEHLVREAQLRNEYERKLQEIELEREYLNREFSKQGGKIESEIFDWQQKLRAKDEEIVSLRKQMVAHDEEVRAENRWKLQSMESELQKLRLVTEEKEKDLLRTKHIEEQYFKELATAKEKLEAEYSKKLNEQEKSIENRVQGRIQDYEIRIREFERDRARLIQDYEDKLRRFVPVREGIEYSGRLEQLNGSQEKIYQMETQYRVEKQQWEELLKNKEGELERIRYELANSSVNNRLLAEKDYKIKSLEDEIGRIITEKSQLEKGLRGKENEIIQLDLRTSREIEDKDKKIFAISQELTNLKSSRAQLEEEIRRKQKEISGIETKLLVMEKEIRVDYETKMRAVNTAYQQLVKEMESLKTSYTTVVNDRDSLKKRNTELETLVNKKDRGDTGYNNIMNKVTQLEKELETRQKETEQVVAKYTQTQNEFSKEIETRKTVETKCQWLEKKVQELKELQDHQLTEGKDKVKELREEHDRILAEQTIFVRRNKELQGELEKEKQYRIESEKKRDEFNAKLNDVASKMVFQSEKIRELEERENAIKSESDQKDQLIFMLNRKIEDLEKKVIATRPLHKKVLSWLGAPMVNVPK